jgi:hypothetical protein
MEANAEYKMLLQKNADFAELLKDFTAEEEESESDELVCLEYDGRGV